MVSTAKIRRSSRVGERSGSGGHHATLDVDRRVRSHRPFQPAGRVVAGDLTFWRDLVDTTNWPGTLTPVTLAAIDLRDVAVPLPFPLWSSESDESDWLPERPLPEPTLAADDRALARAIDDYYARPDMDALLHVIGVFQTVSRDGGPVDDPVCTGTAGSHTHAVDCFEARRWISSLAAVHLLRAGIVHDVHHEIATIWWDTGEAGVSAALRTGSITRGNAVAWLYLGSIFAPDGFLLPESILAEDSGYMGQFLVSEGFARLAVFVTLRRMVASGPIHDALPEQAYWDLNLAVLRAPRELSDDVAEFGFDFLLERQAQGQLPSGDAAALAIHFVERVVEMLTESGGTADPDRDAAIRARADQLLARLESAVPGRQ